MPKPNIGQGDTGTTSLLGGTGKVPKDSAQVEAYGSLDELVSLIGYTRACYTQVRPVYKEIDALLEKIQDHLFRIESHVSASGEWKNHPSLPHVGQEHVAFLEDEITEFEKDLPELTNFILPGGTTIAALLHMARAQTRTCERRLVTLNREGGLHPYAIPYLNRLSDLFFALARWENHNTGLEEQNWVGLGKKGI